tara:strand:+ start:1096 stop:1515 length:420 start_codon:yes stop_codon:yes gene_type:complete
MAAQNWYSKVIAAWTAEETATLKELWGSGVTARQISAVIGRSRGAVIGRANRLGLSTPKPAAVCESVRPLPATKMENCQFPIGNHPYRWCSEPPVPGNSTDVYCAAHYAKCYRPRIGVSDKFEKQKDAKPIVFLWRPWT